MNDLILSPVGPIPPIDEVAIKVTDPVEEGPADIFPGLLPRQGQLVIAGETNVGKAQPLDAKILTASGWKEMGNLQIGDTLLSHDNIQSSVVAIHPRGIRQVYKITFTDGRVVEACAEHLWRVYSPNWMEGGRKKGLSSIGRVRQYRLMTTEEIMKSSKHLKSRLYIDLAEDLDFDFNENINLPVDPWLLGMLIGDGSLTGGCIEFTTIDPHIVNRAAVSIPDYLTIHKKPSADIVYSIVKRTKKGGGPNPLRIDLESMGLMGCRSFEKFIPDRYMNADRTARENLLAGLMDTDGYVSKTGLLQYTTTSLKLAKQVMYLVRSLGGFAKMSSKMAGYRDQSGTRHETRIAYAINIGHSTPKRFVSLPRKLARLKNRRRSPRLRFATIEASRTAETRCITVSHPDGLYITNDFTVTHNSLISLEIISSLTTGAPLWGELEPSLRAKRILFCLGEHHDAVIQRLWQKTQLPLEGDVYLLGPEALGFDKWLIAGGKPNLQAITKLKKWAEGMDLVVFDPLSAFISGGGESSENDNLQMRALLDCMSLISQGNGASCLILAHQGKPMMDIRGQEHARKSYAVRGASAVEDASTNIMYFGKAEGSEASQKASDGQIFELRTRKYKGDAPATRRLLRDSGTLTHTLLNNERPFADIQKIAAQGDVARLLAYNPDLGYREAIKLVAAVRGVAESTVKRHLGIRD